MPKSREEFDKGLNVERDKRIVGFLESYKDQVFTATEISGETGVKPFLCTMICERLLNEGKIGAKFIEGETYYGGLTEKLK